MPLAPQLSLGGVIFGLSTSGIDTVSRTLAASWPGIPRAGRRPKHQFTGIEEEPITINAEYYPDVHGESVEAELRALLLKGKPVNLTLGGGENGGMWAITEIQADNSVIMGGGVVRKKIFSVTIKKVQ